MCCFAASAAINLEASYQITSPLGPLEYVTVFPNRSTKLASGRRVGKQNQTGEQPCRVAEVRLVSAISASKRDRVLGGHYDLARIGCSGTCAFHLVKGRVPSVAFNECIEEGFAI